MICCLNPDCPKPLNQDNHQYCQSCGKKLSPLLRSRFKIIKPLGRGGFGKTYLAQDEDKFNEDCVVKQLVYQSQSPQENNLIIDLFMREAKQLQQLWAHHQIPSLSAYFEEEGYLYLVQQYIDGQDLLYELEDQGCFSDQKTQALLKELLPVLKEIHQKNVIHRDIKPENIMRRSSDGKLILIDFGVSKQFSASIVSDVGTMVGSLGYAAPEQMESGNAYPSSDLYSLGASCFHLMTGINPWSLWKRHGYGWLEQWKQHVKQPISDNLAMILDGLLQIEVSDRYSSAQELLDIFNPYTTIQERAVEILNAVPGMTNAHSRDFKSARPIFSLRDGSVIKSHKNFIGVQHIFIANNNDQLVFGGYIEFWKAGYNYTPLYEALNKIKKELK